MSNLEERKIKPQTEHLPNPLTGDYPQILEDIVSEIEAQTRPDLFASSKPSISDRESQNDISDALIKAATVYKDYRLPEKTAEAASKEYSEIPTIGELPRLIENILSRRTPLEERKSAYIALAGYQRSKPDPETVETILHIANLYAVEVKHWTAQTFPSSSGALALYSIISAAVEQMDPTERENLTQPYYTFLENLIQSLPQSPGTALSELEYFYSMKAIDEFLHLHDSIVARHETEKAYKEISPEIYQIRLPIKTLVTFVEYILPVVDTKDLRRALLFLMYTGHRFKTAGFADSLWVRYLIAKVFGGRFSEAIYRYSKSSEDITHPIIRQNIKSREDLEILVDTLQEFYNAPAHAITLLFPLYDSILLSKRSNGIATFRPAALPLIEFITTRYPRPSDIVKILQMWLDLIRYTYSENV